MQVKKIMAKSSIIRPYSITGLVLMVILVAVTLVTFAGAVHAQEQKKPKLVPIILEEKNNDPKAGKIAETLLKQHIKRNNLEGIYEYSDIFARFIPIQKNTGTDIFIAAQIMQPPLGCYAQGCDTRIFHSKDNGKTWNGVFSATLKRIWYDESSKANSHANIIATSQENNTQIAVWMWNGQIYQLVNGKK